MVCMFGFKMHFVIGLRLALFGFLDADMSEF